MRITPEKWQCSPWGDAGGGFWVVGELDGAVVWYNDIEDGFNVSPCTVRGIIDQYACNQRSFQDFLLTLPAAKQAEAEWTEDSLPPEIQSGGKIARQQTTYWDLRTPGGDIWRAHFKSKMESRYVHPTFSKAVLAQQHPVLNQYAEPWKELYFKGQIDDPDRVMQILATRILEATTGWRAVDEYLEHANLSIGYGLLMRAPSSLVTVASHALNEHGIATSILEYARKSVDPRVLVLGDSFVVAQTFRFERMSNGPLFSDR